MGESNDGVSVTANCETMIQEKWFAGMNQRDYGAIQSVYADDVLFHRKEGAVSGSHEIVKVAKLWHDVMPDSTMTSLCMTWDKDILVAHWKCTGILIKPLRHLQPTATPVTFFGHTCFRFAAERVVEHWACVDYRAFNTPIEH